MQPWMILALLLAGGGVVLLIAPTLHRRSVARSRAGLAERQQRRAQALRSRPDSISITLPTRDALRVRDALLLRGVRVEMERGEATSVLVAGEGDQATVEMVVTELT